MEYRYIQIEGTELRMSPRAIELGLPEALALEDAAGWGAEALAYLAGIEATRQAQDSYRLWAEAEACGQLD